jgi:dipeptidyl aminopeptidase/acylaminoacyl peptidase
MEVALPLLVSCAIGAPAFGQSVRVARGNLFYDPPGDQAPRQLTSSGHDAVPALSADGHLVAFVRTTRLELIDTGSGQDSATDLWVVAIDGSQARRVLEARASDDLKRVLAGINTLEFSPDGRSVYFISAAWATSGAIHVFDLATAQERFVCNGNSLEVVRAGQYVGDLLVEQHRYHDQGGSYDWVWLISPDGRELAPVGDPGSTGFDARIARFRGKAPHN